MWRDVYTFIINDFTEQYSYSNGLQIWSVKDFWQLSYETNVYLAPIQVSNVPV